MKQLDLFTGQESDYVERFPSYFSHFDTPSSLERLLSRLNVVEVGLFHLGERMKKRPISPNYQGLCPFHKEKTPSFYLQPQKNRFHCYGCGIWGGPLRLDSALGEKIYPIIAEKANLTDLLPYLSLNLIISVEFQQSASQPQREYLTVLREALQRESKGFY